MIKLLEQENDISMYLDMKTKPRAFGEEVSESQQSDLNRAPLSEKQSPEDSSLYIILDLLLLGLWKSVDERIVWQTCNLLS